MNSKTSGFATDIALQSERFLSVAKVYLQDGRRQGQLRMKAHAMPSILLVDDNDMRSVGLFVLKMHLEEFGQVIVVAQKRTEATLEKP